MDMVERVARSFHAGTLYAPWDEMPEAGRADFLGHARRAIKTIRELSEVDISACHAEPTENNLNYWRKMMDAFLTSSEPTANGPPDSLPSNME